MFGFDEIYAKHFDADDSIYRQRLIREDICDEANLQFSVGGF